MMTLLRSVIIVKPTDSEDLFLRNFMLMEDSGLGFTVLEDITTWKFIQDFVKAHNHVPGVDTIRTHFNRIGENEVIDRLEVVVNVSPLTRGDFQIRVENKAEDLRVRVSTELLRDAGTILTSGLDVPDGGKGKFKQTKHLRGPQDSFYYLMDQAHRVVTPTMGTRISGEATSDGATVEARYRKVKNDPLSGVGQFSGIMQIDQTLQGAQRQELWIHAAFTGQMKSTFLFNWVYNQSVYYLNSSLTFSLEMPYIQCLNMLYAMHSFHEKFKPIRHKLGLQKHPDSEWGLDYALIKFGRLWDKLGPDGKIDERAEEFFLKHVIPDFNDAKNNYGKIHIEVKDPNKTEMTMADVRRVAERIYAKSPFSMIGLDHMGYLDPRGYHRSTTESLNEICKDAKNLALYFNRGLGMAVVGLFQMSRDGFRNALKVKEKTGTALYNLTALSYANEAERSADKVTTTFVDDDLRAKNRVRFQCLKSRDLVPFPTFLARVEGPCRRILTAFDDVQGVVGVPNDEPDEDISEIELVVDL